MKRLILLFALLAAIPAYGQWNGFQPNVTGGNTLTVNVSDGDVSSTLGLFKQVAQSFVMTKNTTNYVYLDLSVSPPVIKVNTTGFPTVNVYQIATVVTDSAKITSWHDARPPFNPYLYGGGSGSQVCFEVNGVALPCQPFANLVPPLTGVDNPANTRTDISCTPFVNGASHTGGCASDPGAPVDNTKFLRADNTYQVPPGSGGTTVLPDVSTAIQYAAVTCNASTPCSDANDGLSWGTAKQTIYTALCSLPSGNCGTQLAGSGTVYVGEHVTANTSVTNGGIWIMGPNDPGYGSTPAGWLKCAGAGCNVNIIGVANAAGGPNGHKPRVNLTATGKSTDNNFPGLWISSTANNIYIANLQFATLARSIVLGECSNNLRDGTCGVQDIIFDNVGGLNAQNVNTGPCTTIGGNSFWLWFRDFGCAGNYNAAGGVTDDLHAAVLIDGSTSPGAGLIYFADSNFAGGGIKSKAGSSGTQLYVRDTIEEGDFSHAIPPVVWFTSWDTATSDARLENVQQADGGGGSMQAVVTTPPSAASQPAIYGTIQGPTVIGGQSITSPGAQFNPVGNTFNAFSVSPLKNGGSGIFNNYLVGHSDVARRLAGLTSARFTNLAFSSSASWTFSNSGATSVLTQGLSDPYGGTGAAMISNSTSNDNGLTAGFQLYTTHDSDWVVGGIWTQNNQQAGMVLGCASFPTMPTSYVYSNVGMNKGDGQWQWVWMAEKVSGTGANLAFCDTIHFRNGLTPTLYGPVLYLIPAGTLSDNEVLEFANNMNSVDSACAIGSNCNVAGHPLSSDQYQIRAGGFATTISSATLAANRSVTIPDPLASAVLPLLTGAITGTKCLHTVGTTGIIQETSADCGSGSGGGTVDPSLQYSLTYYNTAGSVGHVGGVNGPTGPNGVPNFWVTIPAAGLATAPQAILAGVPGRVTAAASGVGADIVSTDRTSRVKHTNAGATAISLPGAGTTNFGSSFCYKEKVVGSGAVDTITPVSGTINGGASLAINQGQDALVCSYDNSNYEADPHDPPLVAGTNITLTRSDTGLTVASTSGGGTVTNVATSLPAGQLLAGNTYPDIVKTDLSGDATTSGSAVTTVVKVNGVAYSASPSTNTVPVVTGSNTTTYEAVPNAALANAATTVNGQTCTLGSTCNANAGSTAHGVAVNEGDGAAIASTAVGAQNAILSGVTSADPTYKSLTDLSSELYAGTTTGSVNVLAACPTRAATALTTGMQVSFLPNLANTTTTPTFNLCTLGAKTIIKTNAAVLATNDLITGMQAVVRYDGTNWELQNPQTTSGGGGAPVLSSITAASATNTIANGDFTQFWNSQQVTNSQAAFTHGETGASTGGTVTSNLANQANVKISTASASTATPLSVAQGSVTGTVAFPAFQVATTWNNGSLVGQGIVFRLTDTAHAAGSKIFNIFGGASGTTSEFSVDTQGGTTLGGVLRVPSVPATGTGTTALPNTFLNPGASAVTTFNTAGTFLGVNANSGFTGNMLDFHVNGGASVAALDYQGNLTVASCTGCATGNLNLTTTRWGQQVWSHANGGINNVGAFTGAGGNVCTTPGDLAATATNPAYKTCGTGASANTGQYLGFANGDVFIGTSSNPNNLDLITFAKMSATTATRAWMAEISDASSIGTLGTSDAPTGSNLAGIRYSSVAGDTNYTGVNCNAAACATVSTGVAADTNKHHFEVRMNDVTSTTTFCVDGTCVTLSTDYPNSVAPSTAGLGIILDNTTTTVETLSWSETTLTTVN